MRQSCAHVLCHKCPAGPAEAQTLWGHGSGYDIYNRPPPYNQPTLVWLNVIPMRIGEINTKLQRVTVEVDLRLFWTDARLNFSDACAQELVPNSERNECIRLSQRIYFIKSFGPIQT